MVSILLRPPPLASPASSPSPSPSPISTALPPLQSDLAPTSGPYLDVKYGSSSARSPRRIRFAPLPEPDRDLLDPQSPSVDAPQSTPAQQLSPHDAHDGPTSLSPTVSRDSTASSARPTPTPHSSADAPSKAPLKFLRRLSFLRRADSKSPTPHSPPSSRSSFSPSIPHSSTTPSFHSPKLSRISTDDFFSFGTKSLFRSRSASVSSTATCPPHVSSPPPKRSGPPKPLRPASAGSGLPMKSTDEKRNWGEGSSHDSATVGSRRSSISSFGAGGGRHTSSVKMFTNSLPPRPSTAPSSPLSAPGKHVRMLNGRVYGAKRYAAQTLANPFANVREEPEFVEWGYGGMGSVDASAGIGNEMWKGLQRSERGGALLAGSFDSHSASGKPTAGAGDGKGSGARRRMSVDVPECGMGNVGAGGGMDEDDGSGIAWLKRRRAEKEAKAQEARDLERKTQEKRKSGDSLDVSMYGSTASTTTSLTACTSVASTDLTTPTTSPLTSRSPSIADLQLTPSPSSEPRDISAALPATATEERCSKSVTTALKDEHHVLAAVRLSPNISSLSRKHEQTPSSPADTEMTSSDDEEPRRCSDEEEEQDDIGEDVEDVKRKTALGAGVEKISRHVDVEAR